MRSHTHTHIHTCFSFLSLSLFQIKAFVPLRWKMAALHQLMMQCPWSSGNSAFRVFMSLVGLASIGLFVFSLLKSQITWSKWAVSASSLQLSSLSLFISSFLLTLL